MKNRLNILQIIKSEISNLSKGHKIIGEYILTNYENVAFMTASQLANNVSVSESTVVRFAVAIGLSGYKELQCEVQELIKDKLTTVERINFSDEFTDYKNTVQRVITQDIENLENVLHNLNYDDLEKAIKLIRQAKNIYILGLRSSTFLAGYLGFYLNFLLPNVSIIEAGPNDIFEHLIKITDQDVIIGISYPRYSKKTLDALEYANKKNIKIIGITDNLISPATKFSDVTLIASSNMISFVDSLVAPMSLINALIILLGVDKKEDIKLFFKDLEDIWKEFDIYKIGKD